MLEVNEYTRAYEPYDQNADVAGEKHIVIALDTTITPQLEKEGYARDIIRIIQDMRKEAGYDVSDRVFVSIQGSVSEILAEYGDSIMNETLSTFVEQLSQYDLQKIEVFENLGSLEIAIARAS